MDARQSFDVARDHHRAGRLTEAEAIYLEILAAEPRHSDALHLVGVIAGQNGRHEEAVKFISQAVAINPDHPEAWKNLGVALKSAGQPDAALAAYQKAITLKPDYAEAYRNMGNVLYEIGRMDEAADAYRHAIAFKPDFAEAYSSLGVALRDAGKLDEAVAACRQAAAIRPAYADAHSNLGNALYGKGGLDEAIVSYRMALRLAPGFAPAWNNLGIALVAKGASEEGIAAYQRAIALRPDYAEAYGNLGHALKALDRIGEAIASFRKANELKPDVAEWRHLLAALTGNNSATTTPAGYVRKLFDPYAGEFDVHLTGQLNYRVPEQLLDAVLALAPGRHFDILDLGCGTGLCGARFRPVAKHLAGVDLSPAMIEKANARGIYDSLLTANVSDAMRDRGESFDLILAGDVFIYVGDLEDVFAAAARTLRNGGLFAFSLERHDGDGFFLHSKVRFAHSLGYIRELSRTHRLTEIQVREISVRKSRTDDVAGWIVVLGKP